MTFLLDLTIKVALILFFYLVISVLLITVGWHGV